MNYEQSIVQLTTYLLFFNRIRVACTHNAIWCL